MSVWGKLFGWKKDVAPTPQEAIQKLRETEEMLQKKSDLLEKNIEEELATAKQHSTKNKCLALRTLKRKKQYEKQLQQIDGTMSTIEYQRDALENASTNTEVLNVMGSAAKALKAAHSHMDVDKAHKLMDDIAEQQEVANEISEAIYNPIGFGQGVDEDELMAELKELEQEEVDQHLLDIDPAPPVKLLEIDKSELLPAKKGPATKARKIADDDDMEELEAWTVQ